MHPLIARLLFDWPWRPITVLVLCIFIALYVRGWVRSRRAYPKLATVGRLLLFVAGVTVVALAMTSPVYLLQRDLLAARVAQQILLGIVAPPLLWLACPFHVIVWGMPPSVRKMVTRRVLLKTSSGRIGHFITRPVFAWLGTVSIFLLWHDPQVVSWLLENEWIYSLALWIFLAAYLLFWWHLVRTAPRIHPAMPAGVAFLYIILGGEVPNMITGVTLAFQDTPTYSYYAAHDTVYSLTSIQDQRVSGGMIWFVGSFAYVSTAIILLARFFEKDALPPRLPLSWDATDRTIAPGLEHRVVGSRWRQQDR